MIVCVCANLWDIICKFSCLTVGGAQYGPHEGYRVERFILWKSQNLF